MQRFNNVEFVKWLILHRTYKSIGQDVHWIPVILIVSCVVIVVGFNVNNGVAFGVGFSALLICVVYLYESFEQAVTEQDSTTKALRQLRSVFKKIENRDYAELRMLSDQFFALHQKTEELRRQLPADEDELTILDAKEEFNKVNAKRTEALDRFWTLYNWYKALLLDVPGEKIGDFRTKVNTTENA